jgi:hypothetical protein
LVGDHAESTLIYLVVSNVISPNKAERLTRIFVSVRTSEVTRDPAEVSKEPTQRKKLKESGVANLNVVLK